MMGIPWWASHSPSSTSLGFAASVMKLPLTMSPEYSSRKKKGGLREDIEGIEASGPAWLSKDMEEFNAGDWGRGGTFEGRPEDEYGDEEVGEGVPLPDFPWGPLLLERPARFFLWSEKVSVWISKHQSRQVEAWSVGGPVLGHNTKRIRHRLNMNGYSDK